MIILAPVVRIQEKDSKKGAQLNKITTNFQKGIQLVKTFTKFIPFFLF
eukprot:UN17692